MKKQTIKILSLCLVSAFSFTARAFDWPQKETLSDSFYSYFGQLRGSTISTSLIFNDSSEIKASETGNVLCVIEEPKGGFTLFESTLGNAVIIEHENSIVTIYGNLDSESLNEDIKEKEIVTKGDQLGISSNSGWQDGQSCLEFQVMDIKNKCAVNPRLLMPRIGRELPLTLNNIILIDRDGVSHNLLQERRLKTGTYYIYRDRQTIAVPYSTGIMLNGIFQESIRYDSLYQNQGKLCAAGNSKYSVETLYPDNKKQFVGQTKLTKGHNTLSITVTNILGVTEQIKFNIESY